MRIMSKLSPLAISVLLACGAACSSGSPAGGGGTGGGTVVGTGGKGTGGAVSISTGGAAPLDGTGGSVSTTGGNNSGTGGAVSGTGGAASGSGGSVGTGGAAAGGRVGGSTQPGSGGAVGPGGAGGPVNHKEFILYEDSAGKLFYVNNTTPSSNWTVNSGTGRDLQLIGGGKVMLGKGDGWDEYMLSNGAKSGGVHGFSGTQTAHRMADGNTILATAGAGGISLKFVSPAGMMVKQITYAGFSYVRMVRPTKAGTYMVAADTVAFEGNEMGMVLSQATIPGGRHTWKAMKLADGNIAVTSGYGSTLLLYDSTWKLLVTMGGKAQPMAAAIKPTFYADFHVMPNGNFFVINSQADSPNENSIQMLEYSPAGALVWSQKQPAGAPSVEEGIVLDGLDTSKLQVEPEGMLISAP